jgi:hypothetical protein
MPVRGGSSAGVRFDERVGMKTLRDPRAELDAEGAASSGLRFVGGLPYCRFLAAWFRHRTASVGAARPVGHNHAVRVR